MSKTIQELATEMTKEEFLNYADNEEICPHDYDLKDNEEECSDGTDISICHKCWSAATENIQFKDNALLFENRSVEILKALKESEETYKKLEEQRDGLKEELKNVMEQYGIEKWENKDFSITYVKGGPTTSVDSAKLKKLHPDIYNECNKSSVRKASIRFKVK